MARLSEISSYHRKCLRDRHIHIIESETPVVPIYTYEEENTLRKARELFDAGVYVNPVITPACAEHECLLRTSCMATLTEALVEEADDIIASIIPHEE